MVICKYPPDCSFASDYTALTLRRIAAVTLNVRKTRVREEFQINRTFDGDGDGGGD